jgi:hypothetical protein
MLGCRAQQCLGGGGRSLVAANLVEQAKRIGVAGRQLQHVETQLALGDRVLLQQAARLLDHRRQRTPEPGAGKAASCISQHRAARKPLPQAQRRRSLRIEPNRLFHRHRHQPDHQYRLFRSEGDTERTSRSMGCARSEIHRRAHQRTDRQ